jgi:hypothetical protein
VATISSKSTRGSMQSSTGSAAVAVWHLRARGRERMLRIRNKSEYFASERKEKTSRSRLPSTHCLEKCFRANGNTGNHHTLPTRRMGDAAGAGRGADRRASPGPSKRQFSPKTPPGPMICRAEGSVLACVRTCVYTFCVYTCM